MEAEYIVNMVAEAAELNAKISKLANIDAHPIFPQLTSQEKHDINRQKEYMFQYYEVLMSRIEYARKMARG